MVRQGLPRANHEETINNPRPLPRTAFRTTSRPHQPAAPEPRKRRPRRHARRPRLRGSARYPRMRVVLNTTPAHTRICIRTYWRVVLNGRNEIGRPHHRHLRRDTTSCSGIHMHREKPRLYDQVLCSHSCKIRQGVIHFRSSLDVSWWL